MHPISETLCKAYRRLYNGGQVKFPLHKTQEEAIDSIVKTVNGHWFGVERYPTVKQKAVAYLCLIIKNHAVTDGNKRLALLWFEVYCIINELKTEDFGVTMDVLAVAIEKQKELRLEDLIKVVHKILFGNVE